MNKIIPVLIILLANISWAQTEITAQFQAEIIQRKQLQYALHIPTEIKQRKSLIVFLHGSGEKGTDIQKVKAHGPFKYLRENNIDAYVLAPQCPDDQYWDSELLHRLIQKIVSENAIDPQRIYLTGLSMGAWGAWNLAFAYPKTFAALVPIAGYVDRVPMIENCKIKNIPIRMFHGLLDDVVDPQYSIEIYKRLKPCNPDIELVIFDDAKHDSWTRVYEDKAIYEWMLKQKKI